MNVAGSFGMKMKMKIASVLLQCKKTAFQVTRDREKLCEQVATGKDSKGKPLAEKDLTKV